MGLIEGLYGLNRKQDKPQPKLFLTGIKHDMIT